ncbi:putative amino-acid atp-binding abc transporter protein [Sulfitobacter noctilucicola]|uniref:Branched-chain amino acid transport system ATP-binding protein n=1 Tax=Sulfitobacter noctilucicola TaxID=1342301 RepID=A0A7W6Q689_9RHOB|nr:ABC transporter ATP-binding protein [Sulfitobacter noctilucicola]KIN70204.1 putative amino-acid atp-binding abc transporter protein [Sulfitobacter noctilucicola]MBB4176109.1 branched-chain amino acid transport system ATP-binding protein [Sulfitobacter noctilucicola]
MSAPALELTGLKKSFGKAEIIRGIDLSIGKAERHAIIGPNGAGKSTLFNLITARFPPTAGTVKLHGEDLAGLEPYQINRKGLSRSFQITNIFPKMSVFENVRCALLWAQGYKYSFWNLVSRSRGLNEGADAILEQINLLERRDVAAGLLSYAEQRALEIGITIAGGADVIMLDEPTAGMSHSETDYITDLILKVTAGKTLIMVEHDMGVVFGLADRISVLVYGEIIATNTPELVRADPKVQEAYLGAALEAEH